MTILISPNAFKHALTAMDAARAIEEGVRRAAPDAHCILLPIGDGGDGTGDLLIALLQAEKVSASAVDPFGSPIETYIGYLPQEKTAIIEMCYASGIRLVAPDQRDPLRANSYGTGMLMKQALDIGARKIIIGMGGSATVDGGMGMLSAVGVKFIGSGGSGISYPRDLVDLEKIDISEMDSRISDCEIVVLCDVENKLLGEQGAAAVFGPQKGATAEMVKHLDKALGKMSAIAFAQSGSDMSGVNMGGTAGGAAAGLYAVTEAKLVRGIDYFLDQVKFDEQLSHADIVITGEGSLDEQTLHGKGPFGVALRAKGKGVSVVGLAGVIDDPRGKLSSWFDVLKPINKQPFVLAEALKNTKRNLADASYEIINEMRDRK
jgi:glycerate kinase